MRRVLDDTHDWMGAWPCRSMFPARVESVMGCFCFDPVCVFTARGAFGGRRSGFLGSGCGEYVYRWTAGAGV